MRSAMKQKEDGENENGLQEKHLNLPESNANLIARA